MKLHVIQSDAVCGEYLVFDNDARGVQRAWPLLVCHSEEEACEFIDFQERAEASIIEWLTEEPFLLVEPWLVGQSLQYLFGWPVCEDWCGYDYTWCNSGSCDYSIYDEDDE